MRNEAYFYFYVSFRHPPLKGGEKQKPPLPLRERVGVRGNHNEFSTAC
jgi:hypothetical protein